MKLPENMTFTERWLSVIVGHFLDDSQEAELETGTRSRKMQSKKQTLQQAESSAVGHSGVHASADDIDSWRANRVNSSKRLQKPTAAQKSVKQRAGKSSIVASRTRPEAQVRSSH